VIEVRSVQALALLSVSRFSVCTYLAAGWRCYSCPRHQGRGASEIPLFLWSTWLSVFTWSNN